MTKPNNFILNTDFATLKNDDTASVALAITTNSPALPNGTTYTYSNTVDVGTINAGIRCQIRTSLAPTVIYSSPQMQITLQATINTTPTPTVIDCPTTVYITRTDANTITINCQVYGIAAGYTTTITGGFQTITADISTFLSPFA